MRKQTLVIEVTLAQLESLLSEVDGGMCRADARNDRTARKVWEKILSAITEAKQELAPILDRSKPCAICSKMVVHSERGLQLPAPHNCPHGNRCSGAHSRYSWNSASRCYQCWPKSK